MVRSSDEKASDRRDGGRKCSCRVFTLFVANADSNEGAVGGKSARLDRGDCTSTVPASRNASRRFTIVALLPVSSPIAPSLV